VWRLGDDDPPWRAAAGVVRRLNRAANRLIRDADASNATHAARACVAFRGPARIAGVRP